MIEQKEPFDQLPNEIKPAFKELKVLQHLNTAGFKKKFGFTCSYLFRLVFVLLVLLFHQKNWFRLLESNKAESFPGKDAVYRFLNHTGYAWRRFLMSLSADTIHKVEKLTSDNRVRRSSSTIRCLNVIEARPWNFWRGSKIMRQPRFTKAFRMLTMGWSDGHSFILMDFALLSSTKSGINSMIEGRQVNIRLQATSRVIAVSTTSHRNYDRSCSRSRHFRFLCVDG